MRLSCTYFPVLVLYPFACISRASKRAWWRLLLFACEHSGPTFIKLGQWASTRRDLFDEEFCVIFSKLHSQTQKHSWYWTKQKLRKAFGKNWKKIFAKIERKPVGSGCIAQVRPKFLSMSPVFSYGVPNITLKCTIIHSGKIIGSFDFKKTVDKCQIYAILNVMSWIIFHK